MVYMIIVTYGLSAPPAFAFLRFKLQVNIRGRICTLSIAFSRTTTMITRSSLIKVFADVFLHCDKNAFTILLIELLSLSAHFNPFIVIQHLKVFRISRIPFVSVLFSSFRVVLRPLALVIIRSEERRVGKEGRSRWSPY